MEKIKGHILNLVKRRWIKGELVIDNGTIADIIPHDDVPDRFIIPGFVDAHIHVESSMLTPYNFARKALTFGTIATVSDPHEIANVCGMAGVEYMLDNTNGAGLRFFFGAPSCVPATAFETSGAVLNSADIENLLGRDEILYLSEMMNYPGVLHNDPEVMMKINCAKKHQKPVDGHAPGLTGTDAIRYINAGISTDHECYTLEEALFKIEHGMKVIIREGSAARNFDALHSLISSHTGSVMLCSDDKHPDELIEGHMDRLVARAVAEGHDIMDVLQCATLNPIQHYGLDIGLLNTGDPADFIVLSSLEKVHVKETYIRGELFAKDGKCMLDEKKQPLINNFSCTKKSPEEFEVTISDQSYPVIGALDGQLITESRLLQVRSDNGLLIPDLDRDMIKLVVVNRYSDTEPSVCFIQGIGLKKGAFASTVAHDSHNIIAAGVDDESICEAVNLVIEAGGGLSVVNETEKKILPLPVAGLMSDLPCDEVAASYKELDRMVKNAGSALRAPFMTLSFMALLVIPELKLSDKGLFDGKSFSFVAAGE
jgi:adenine deaminase